MRSLSIGADNGATWLRVAATEAETGKALWRIKVPCARPHDVPHAVSEILKKKHVKPTFLTVSSTGIWEEKDRRRLRREISQLCRFPRVLSDIEIAWLGALGGQPGVVVLAGTGSFAYGRDSCGHWRREGGLGALLGDEGSAFWIGKEWIKKFPDRALRLAHDPTPVRTIAALAPMVIGKAAKNDRRARAILNLGQEALVAQMESVAGGLRLKRPVRISWYGGLFNNAVFRNAFLKRLSKSRKAWNATPPVLEPEIAAALLPLRFPQIFSVRSR